MNRISAPVIISRIAGVFAPAPRWYVGRHRRTT